MNKNFLNFLNESIYDIDVLKNIDLGDKFKKEIFTEAKKMTPSLEIDGNNSNKIKIYYGGPSSDLPMSSSSASSAPAQKVKSMSPDDLYHFIAFVDKEASSINNILELKHGGTNTAVENDFIKDVSAKNSIKQKYLEKNIRLIKRLVAMNWLKGQKFYTESTVISKDKNKAAEMIIKVYEKSYNKATNLLNIIKSYLSATSSIPTEVDFSSINKIMGKIGLNKTNDFINELQKIIASKYDLT